MEGQWFRHVVETKCIEQKIAADATTAIARSLERFLESAHGFGFCLTKNPDQLSQWRGYADDGHGVAIGFQSAAFGVGVVEEGINQARVELKKASYDCEEQHTLLSPFMHDLAHLADMLPEQPIRGILGCELRKNQYDSACADIGSALWPQLIANSNLIYQLKNSAFHEEGEWRLLRGDLMFKSAIMFFEQDYRYKALRSKIVPYLPMKFEAGWNGVIAEVILGPKNTTPNRVIDFSLHSHGLSSVKVRRSS